MQVARALISLSLLSGSLDGAPWSPNGPKHLTGSAEAVAVVDVTRSVVRGRAILTLYVERVLKGDIRPGAVLLLSYEFPSDRGISLPEQRLHGLVFLRTEHQQWVAMPCANGAVSFTDLVIETPRDPSPYVLPSGAQPIERVLAEIAWTEENRDPKNPKFDPLLVEWIRSARGIRSPALRQVFRRLAESRVARVRMLGIRGLIATGARDALALAAAQPDDDSGDGAGRYMWEEVKYYFVDPSQEAIASLGALASSGRRPPVRLAAAAALARMHTKETLPHLAALLDSRDADLRACAVGGMAMFANNVPIGSHALAAGPSPFRTNETIAHSSYDANLLRSQPGYYESFWRRWWRVNRAALGY